MSIKNGYLAGVYESVVECNPGEPEFHQAVREVLESLAPVVEKRNFDFTSAAGQSAVIVY